MKSWRDAEAMAFVPDGVEVMRVPAKGGGWAVGLGIKTSPEAEGFTIRINSAKGFKALLMRLVDTACECWPEIAKDFADANEVDE